jgi:hypothetical protein
VYAFAPIDVPHLVLIVAPDFLDKDLLYDCLVSGLLRASLAAAGGIR